MDEVITNQEFKAGDKVILKPDTDYVGPLQYGTEYTVRSVGPDPDHLLGVDGPEEYVNGLWYPWRFTKVEARTFTEGERYRLVSPVRVGERGDECPDLGDVGDIIRIAARMAYPQPDEQGDVLITGDHGTIYTHVSTIGERVETAFGNLIVDEAATAVDLAVAAAREEERAIAQRNLDKIMERLNEASLEGVSGGDAWCVEYDHAVDAMERRLEGGYTLKRRYRKWDVTRRYRVSAWVEHTFEGISAATEEEAIAEARDQSTTSREDAQALRDFLDNGDTPSDDGQSEWSADSAD